MLAIVATAVRDAFNRNTDLKPLVYPRLRIALAVETEIPSELGDASLAGSFRMEVTTCGGRPRVFIEERSALLLCDNKR